MGINIKTGPNATIARMNATMAAAGLDASNLHSIFRVADPLKSFKPGRSINAISGIEKDQGYYLQSLVDMDKEAYFIPPVEEINLIQGLNAYWEFEETTGNFVDRKNGKLLGPEGGYTRTAGKFGKAVTLNGINAKLSAANDILYSANQIQGFTITTWLKINTANFQWVLSKWGNTPDTNEWLLDVATIDGKPSVQFVVHNDSGEDRVVNAPFTSNGSEWIFVVAKIESDTVSLRINNGPPVATTLGNYAKVHTASPLEIGALSSSYWGAFSMDSLGLWQRGLREAEDEALWNDGNGINYNTFPSL